MEYAILSCDHTKIGPKNNTKWKARVTLNSLVVATGLQSPGPRIDTGSARPRFSSLQRERERERGVRVWRWWVLVAVCLLFQCFSAALLLPVCELQARPARPDFQQQQQQVTCADPSSHKWDFHNLCISLGALDCFVSCFCFFFWVSSLKIICDDNLFGFCMCVFGFYFYFPLWDFDCTLRNYVCSRRKKCCWNEERERERGGGGVSTSTTKGNNIISRVFVSCFVKWCRSFSRFQWHEGVPIVGEFKA